MMIIQLNLYMKEAWVCREEPYLTVCTRKEYNDLLLPKKGKNVGGTAFTHSNNAYVFVDNPWNFEEYNCLNCLYAGCDGKDGLYHFPGKCKLGTKDRINSKIKYICKAISHYSIHELIHLAGFEKRKRHSKFEEMRTQRATEALDPIFCDKFVDENGSTAPYLRGVLEGIVVGVKEAKP